MFRGLTDKDWRELKRYVDKNCCGGGGGDPSTDPNNCLTIGSDGNLYYDCSGGEGGNGMFDSANQGGTQLVQNWTIPNLSVMSIPQHGVGFKFQLLGNTSNYIGFSFNASPSILLNTSSEGFRLGTGPISWNNVYNNIGLRLGGTNQSVIHILLSGNQGQVDFPKYGLGNFIGTPAYSLGVSATGQIVEVAGGGGMFDSANQGGTWAVTNATMAAPTQLTVTSDLNTLTIWRHANFNLSFSSKPEIIFKAASHLLILNSNSTSTSCQIYSGGILGTRLGGELANIVHIKLPGSLGQVDFPQYIGTNFDAVPVKSLGVDAVGKVVTFVGAGPAVAGQQEIPNGDITETNSDYTLPPITNIGNIQVVANPSGGSSVTVSPALGNTIEGFALVGNKEGGMFISVSLTRWYRIKG